MLERLSVSRDRFESDRDGVLLEAIINNQRATDPLSPEERIVYDADQYLGSVMMDGHLLAFCNNRLEVAGWENALNVLGAIRELSLFSEALELWKGEGCPEFPDVDDALSDTLDAVDQRFYAAAFESDNLESRTKSFVFDHADSFISFE